MAFGDRHFCSSAAGASVLRVAISPARSSAAALKLCCAVLRFDEMLCAMAGGARGRIRPDAVAQEFTARLPELLKS